MEYINTLLINTNTLTTNLEIYNMENENASACNKFYVPLLMDHAYYGCIDDPYDRAAHHYASIKLMQKYYPDECEIDPNGHTIEFSLDIDDDFKISILDSWDNYQHSRYWYECYEYITHVFKTTLLKDWIGLDYIKGDVGESANDIMQYLYKHNYI